MCQDRLIYGVCGCSSEQTVVCNCKVELLSLSGMSKQPWHAFLVFFRCPSDLHAGATDISSRVLIVERKRQLSEATDV
ncbi:hypothetical protein ACFX12_006066 [Malus domestica]